MTSTTSRLGLPQTLVDALSRQSISDPFPIQEATIPDALAGKDIKGKAPTGSGKTLAFGLPILATVERADANAPKALILAPTRELAEQINAELKPLARSVKRRVAAIYGGVGYKGQLNSLKQGVDVLVATPGRLEDLLEQAALTLADVTSVVIDEADRMADMGFMPAVRRILDKTSDDRQTLLFSATLDGDVAQLSKAYQTTPVTHEAGAVDTDVEEAEHLFWLTKHHDRLATTAEIIRSTDRTIVFTRTRRGADRLAKQLTTADIGAVALHGGLNQNRRNRALRSFSNGSSKALIATDVAARGIHVDDVSTVVHYDVAGDEKDYIHRSGRTGRAGATGTVVTLVMPDQRREVMSMQKKLGLEPVIGEPDHDELTRAPQPAPKAPARPNHVVGDPDQSTTIFVGNLPWSTTADDLDRIFSRHGSVTNTSVATKRGRSKGYGFVEMPESAAYAAMDNLRGQSISGRPMKLKKARPADSRR